MTAPAAPHPAGAHVTTRALVTGVTVSLTTGLAQTCSFATTWVIAGFLPPAGLGAFRLIQIMVTYLTFGHAGTLSAMSRQVPMARGASAPEVVRRVRDAAWTAGFISISGLGLVATCLLAWLPALAAVRPDSPSLVLLPAVTLIWYGWEFHKNWLSAQGRFRLRGWAELAFGLALLACTVMFVPRWGVAGALAALIASRLVAIALAAGASEWPFHLRFSWPESKHLMAVGWPITANGFVRYAFTSADALLAALFLGTHDVGCYVLASVGFSALDVLPGSISVVVNTRMAEARGRLGISGAATHIASLVERLTVPMCEVSLLLGAVLVLVGPVVVRTWLPTYAPGIGALQVLAASHCLVALRLLSGEALNVIDRQATFLRLQVLGVCASLALSATALSLGCGLVGLAVASSTASAATGLLLLHQSLRLVHGAGAPALRFTLRLGGTLAAGVVALALLAGRVGVDDWQRSVAAAGLYVLAATLAFACVFRETSLLAIAATVWARLATRTRETL